MYHTFELDWHGPDGVYYARGVVLGPGYDDCSWTLDVDLIEGPDGPLQWGDCTDLDACGWPEWAHTYAVRAIDSMLEARRYGA